MRECADLQGASALSKYQIFSVIIRVQYRDNFVITEIRNRIHVRDKSDLRTRFITRSCRNLSVDIALFVHMCLHAKFFQLVNKDACKIKLTFGGWDSVACLIAWSSDNDIF